MVDLAKEIQKLLENIHKQVTHGYVEWNVVRDRICDFRDKVLAKEET